MSQSEDRFNDPRREEGVSQLLEMTQLASGEVKQLRRELSHLEGAIALTKDTALTFLQIRAMLRSISSADQPLGEAAAPLNRSLVSDHLLILIELGRRWTRKVESPFPGSATWSELLQIDPRSKSSLSRTLVKLVSEGQVERKQTRGHVHWLITEKGLADLRALSLATVVAFKTPSES